MDCRHDSERSQATERGPACYHNHGPAITIYTSDGQCFRRICQASSQHDVYILFGFQQYIPKSIRVPIVVADEIDQRDIGRQRVQQLRRRRGQRVGPPPLFPHVESLLYPGTKRGGFYDRRGDDSTTRGYDMSATGLDVLRRHRRKHTLYRETRPR